MDRNLATNAVKDEDLQVEETDDSCIFKYYEVVPLNRDTDGSCTTECVSGHWSDDVKEENLADLRPDVVLFCQHILLLNQYCDCSWFKFSVLPVKVKLGMVG